MPTSFLSLLWSHLKLAAWIAVVILAAFSYVEHDRRIRAEAVAESELASYHRTEAVLRDSITQVRGKVFRDTVRLTRVLRDFRTAHDTVNLHDTVQVIRVLATADTAVRACQVTVLDCMHLNRLLTAQVAVKDSQVVTLQHLIPTRAQRIGTRLTWGLAGAGLYAVLSHMVGR